MYKRKKQIIAATLTFALAATTSSMAVMADETEDGTKLASPLLITEVVPNTDNMGSADAYEFFEITNTSNQEIDLKNYDIVYINGTNRTVWTPNITTLGANQTMVVWVKNSGNSELTKSDFLSYYKLSESDLIAEVECNGLSNSGSRSLAIATKTGRDLQTVTYKAADSEDGKLSVDESVSFQYEGEKVTVSYNGTPTPLVAADISGEFDIPEVVQNPTVEIEKTVRINAGEDLQVKVTTSDLDLEKIVSGDILAGDKSYHLTYDENNNLTGSIPFADLAGKETVTYTVSIFDGVNVAISTEQTVKVLQSSEDVDTTKAPALVITELLPDSSNINGADAYEYIEIYNNSDLDINLKDYKLYYNYPDTGSDTIWWETDEDKILKAGETLVFWVKNGYNDSLTIEDFNTQFGTSLNAEQLIEISCGGMANGSIRGMKICSNVKDIVDYVTYNVDGDDTYKDQSIKYQNQYSAGEYHSVILSNQSESTPGTITEDEKPDYAHKTVVPSAEPVIQDETVISYNNSSEKLDFTINAASEETTIKTVKLFVKYNDMTAYDTYNLLREDGDTFTKSFGNIDLLNKDSFTYYFEVSDGTHTVTTQEKTIQNTDAKEKTKLNVSEGELISGQQSIIANGQKIIIDGEDKSSQAVKSLNGIGKIAFDASQTDVFFKNAVSIGSDVLGIFNEGTYENWETYVYDISAEKYDYATKTITVEFHAGNKANVLEHNIENNDDFVLKNIRMVLPDGTTLYPSTYQAKKGLGAVEHANLDGETMQDVSISSQEKEIQMGDGTSKYEILYVTFEVPEDKFEAVRYTWDTKQIADGNHTISNGTDEVNVVVDNTAPVIETNIEDNKEYHSETIQVTASDAISEKVTTTALLDGKTISLPYEFRALEMTSGEHTLVVTSTDEAGNSAVKTVTFTTPNENANVDENVSPENGTTVKGEPTFSVTVTDPSGDNMDVAFKLGERYTLADTDIITQGSGVSSASGTAEDSFDALSGNGFPYESFDVAVGEDIKEDAIVNVKWQGTSNNEKTYMYVYNTQDQSWDKVDASVTIDDENLSLDGNVSAKNHVTDGKVKVIVQNGEGYTPSQNEVATQEVTTSNAADTARDGYDFTFVVESDTQYYNEDYEGNPDKSVDGKYQYQLDIHSWVLANRTRMNIQYLFHDGDIIDDEPNEMEWTQADNAYKELDNAGLAYGVLAGNHDVGHLSGDYSNYSKYFGENRYSQNLWYGDSYKDNRGHYDLITVDGIDFIMVYMGWGIGDEEINWLNEVLAKYPERKAILNFHEYLLASGGLGEEPQRVHDEVVAKNENVCMVFSGHYHNAYTTIDTFTKEDGTTRKVYNMLFDYQGLPEGGLGYMRLLHFDMDNKKVIIRTYSPSLDDYDAKTSTAVNEGNDYVVTGADDSIKGEEEFEISFEDLGIESKVKTLDTTGLEVNVYGTETLGTAKDVVSGNQATYTWTDAKPGTYGWYAEITDANGGLTRTNVSYITVEEEETTEETTTKPEETTEETTKSETTTVEETTKSETTTVEETTTQEQTTTVETSVQSTEGKETTTAQMEKKTTVITQESNLKTGDTARTGFLSILTAISGALVILGIKKKKRIE